MGYTFQRWLHQTKEHKKSHSDTKPTTLAQLLCPHQPSCSAHTSPAAPPTPDPHLHTVQEVAQFAFEFLGHFPMLSKLSIRYEELPNTRVQPLNVLQGGDTSLKSKSVYVCVHVRTMSVLCTYVPCLSPAPLDALSACPPPDGDDH